MPHLSQSKLRSHCTLKSTHLKYSWVVTDVQLTAPLSPLSGVWEDYMCPRARWDHGVYLGCKTEVAVTCAPSRGKPSKATVQYPPIPTPCISDHGGYMRAGTWPSGRVPVDLRCTRIQRRNDHGCFKPLRFWGCLCLAHANYYKHQPSKFLVQRGTNT